MSGMLPTHSQKYAQRLFEVVCVALVFSLVLSGCSADKWVGDGRGDWTLDVYEGYAISKINSREILLIHKENPDDSGGSIVLPNYFVVAYQLQKPFICLEGIRTQKMAASEDEINEMRLSYYIVDTTDGEVVGPFESYEDFVGGCSSLAIEVDDKWMTPRKMEDG